MRELLIDSEVIWQGSTNGDVI